MSVLSHPVLVLNKGWVPISVISVKRALHMMISDSARAVDADDFSTYDFDSWADLGKIFEDGEFIKTTRMRIPVPEVLLLDEFNRVPMKSVTFSRRNLYKRDEYTCQYCGKRPHSSELTIDHITPVSKGGKTTWTNCVLACLKCNHKKSDRTLTEAGMKLLSVPAEPPRKKIAFAVPISQKRVSWEKFLNDPKTRDAVASDVYWNAKLKD